MKKRAIECAIYIIEKKCTVREAASVLHISKSTVHKDVSERIKEIDRELFKEVRKILEVNLSERHIRGGEATKLKYKREK
jgi:putative DeoR family transcriptional regulator (stage III sporulation protein D)